MFQFQQWVKNPYRFIFILAGLIPPFFILSFILQYGANVPYWDQWDASLNVAIATADGRLTLETIFRRHNEHRIVFSNLLTAFLTVTAQWNLRLELLASFLLATGNLTMLLGIIRHQVPKVLPVAVLPLTALVFSLSQSTNWLSGLHSSWFFVVFFAIAAFFVLTTHKPGWRPLLIASFLCICSTLSIGIGILSVPAVYLGLFLWGYRRWQHYLLWGMTAVVATAWFLIGYNFGGDESSSSNIIDLFTYIVHYITSPLVMYMTPPTPWILYLVFGVGLLVFISASAYLWVKHDRSTTILAPWWALSMFSFGAAILTAVGRVYLGVNQAFSPRYTTVSNLFWISVVVLVLYAIHIASQQSDIRLAEQLILSSYAIVAVIAIGMYIQVNLINFNRHPIHVNATMVDCVEALELTGTTSCLTGLYPDTAVLSERINLLRDRQLTVFAQTDLGVLSLEGLPLVFIGPQVQTSFYPRRIQGETVTVLFQHAPSVVQQTLVLPTDLQQAALETAVFVDQRGVNTNPDLPQDGVQFFLDIIREDGAITLAYTRHIDPWLVKSPEPVTVDLTRYIGETIILQYRTEAGENPTHDAAMWVEPVLIR